MADTAAFFAKKKKKKSFKFNANKIDASQVISTVHVDAPAVSSAVDNTVSTLKSMTVKDSKTPGDTGPAAGGGDWDDVALTAKVQKPAATSAVVNTNTGGGGAAELLDMKALEKKRNEQDDIAERLRVEETKAKLAAAREGMEKEGQRLKEAKEAKNQPKTTAAPATGGGSRFGKASANMFGASAGAADSGKGKWVPPHLRGGGGMAPRSIAPSPSGFQRKVDTQDENLFPDLATADKIIAQEEEQRQHANRKAKAPTAAWGMKRVPTPSTKRDKVPSSQVKQTTAPPPTPTDDKVEKKEEPPVIVKPLVKAVPSVTVASGLKKKTKKKKKDLSTFKAS